VWFVDLAVTVLIVTSTFIIITFLRWTSYFLWNVTFCQSEKVVILYLKILGGMAKYILDYLLLTSFYKIWSVFSFIFGLKYSKIHV
jgi:hypothetical protein